MTGQSVRQIKRAFQALVGTTLGQEPSMYPHIRDIFVSGLSHDSRFVLTDSRTEAGVRPDVSVSAIGPGGSRISSWIVVEAKDEPRAFANDTLANQIFRTKWRYVTPDTEWFIGIDPQTIRIRQITTIERVIQEGPDYVCDYVGGVTDEFLEKLSEMAASRLTQRRRLVDFRLGLPGSFGRIGISTAETRRLFVAALKEASARLSDGIAAALEIVQPDRVAVDASLARLYSDFPSVTVHINPFRANGVRNVPVARSDEFRALLSELREHFRLRSVAFTLETEVYPRYQERTETAAEANKLLKEETSALLLSRMLMLRFFEDYGYFGDRRYLCNGGVAAFQKMLDYFEERYPAWLRQAYQAGGSIYQSVFDLSPLDWILKSKSIVFSAALEEAMLLLAPFNFRTIEEELLSAVYGTFFDDEQRKRQGEHYTPPSIARWIVEQTRTEDFKILDPACGLGTFLVEAFIAHVGRRLRQQTIEFDEAARQVLQICGNDLNTFSGTVAQMQILWNLLRTPGTDEHPKLPQLNVSAGFDSLEPISLFSEIDEVAVTPWTSLDQDRYGSVIGNPPYVRPERRPARPSAAMEEFFSPIGAKANLYNLFVYKAMAQWLRPGGKMGFVIPLTFVDTEDSEKLRQLFQPGGRWKILEIVDMEEIKRAVFPEANVRPIIVIAQNEPPAQGDRVTIRLVDHRCLHLSPEGANVSFDLDAARHSRVPYEQIWASDGRILTRMSAERGWLVNRFRLLQTFREIAMPYWDRFVGSRIVERTFREPAASNSWKRKIVLLRGCVQRGRNASVATGHQVYKGENILPCQITGAPALSTHVDPRLFSDPSLWRFAEQLPPNAYAFSRISMFPTAVGFDPRSIVFMDTATLFAPQANLAAIPFDFLVLSLPYRWYYAVYCRRGVIADYFCQAYPEAVGDLPWHTSLVDYAAELESLKTRFMDSCRNLSLGKKVLVERLAQMDTTTIVDLVEADQQLQLRWGELAQTDAGGLNFERVTYGSELNQFVEVNDAWIAEQLRSAIQIFFEDDMTRASVRSLRLPVRGQEVAYRQAVSDFLATNPRGQVESVLSTLDQLVSSAMGFSDEDLAFMNSDLRDDALFAKFELRLPFQEKTVRGLLQALASSTRYDRVG